MDNDSDFYYVEECCKDRVVTALCPWFSNKDPLALCFNSPAFSNTLPSYMAGHFAAVFLDVPFENKDEAKDLGAKYDPESRRWYIPNRHFGTITPFHKWLPELVKDVYGTPPPPITVEVPKYQCAESMIWNRLVCEDDSQRSLSACFYHYRFPTTGTWLEWAKEWLDHFQSVINARTARLELDILCRPVPLDDASIACAPPELRSTMFWRKWDNHRYKLNKLVKDLHHHTNFVRIHNRAHSPDPHDMISLITHLAIANNDITQLIAKDAEVRTAAMSMAEERWAEYEALSYASMRDEDNRESEKLRAKGFNVVPTRIELMRKEIDECTRFPPDLLNVVCAYVSRSLDQTSSTGAVLTDEERAKIEAKHKKAEEELRKRMEEAEAEELMQLEREARKRIQESEAKDEESNSDRRKRCRLE